MTEAFLIGSWKNTDELEESLCLPELLKILETQAEKERRHQRFLAAIQGIDLDNGKNRLDNEDEGNRISEVEAASFGLAFSLEGESVGETETING